MIYKIIYYLYISKYKIIYKLFNIKLNTMYFYIQKKKNKPTLIIKFKIIN